MAKPTNAAIVDTKGRTWEPFESLDPTGFVEYTEDKGEIHIPYGTDPMSTTIQAHELSHVRYSAKIWPDIHIELPRLMAMAGTSANIVGYAEDMRITALAGRLGIKTLPSVKDENDAPTIKGWIDSFVNVGIPEDRARKAAMFILTQHTSIVKRIGLDLNTLHQKDNAERYIVFAARYIHKLLSTGKDDSRKDKKGTSEKSDKSKSSEKSSEKSEEQSEESDEDESEGQDENDEDSEDSEDTEDGKGASEESDEDEESDESGDGDTEGDENTEESEESESTKSTGSEDSQVIDLSGTPLPDIRHAMIAHVPEPEDIQKAIQTFQNTLDTSPWLPIQKINRMPLVRQAAQARRKGRKLSETGVALGSAYDAVSPNERRPFTARRKGGAGGLTVVIDCSGSMFIAEEQLERLLLTHPQGVVVTYASRIGCYSDTGRDEAVVRVIASHGRLSATENFRDRQAGGNGCDGPILEWLAKQSGERVWICDGVITGMDDRPVLYSPAARDAWLKAHHITQFHSLTAYIASLTKGAC